MWSSVSISTGGIWGYTMNTPTNGNFNQRWKINTLGKQKKTGVRKYVWNQPRIPGITSRAYINLEKYFKKKKRTLAMWRWLWKIEHHLNRTQRQQQKYYAFRSLRSFKKWGRMRSLSSPTWIPSLFLWTELSSRLVWLVGQGHPSEKYESQLGWWNSQYMGK